ncbi:hypothetical protein BJV77DRAFT_664257 [Russula vinacea]|nr:hypothetical protein BJV77DRAFT_664257 [Russula vinacea]
MILNAPVLVLRNRISVISIFAFSHLAPHRLQTRYVSKNTFYAFHMMIISGLFFGSAFLLRLCEPIGLKLKSLRFYSTKDFEVPNTIILPRCENIPTVSSTSQHSILAVSVAGVVSQQHFLFRPYLFGNRIRTCIRGTFLRNLLTLCSLINGIE